MLLENAIKYLYLCYRLGFGVASDRETMLLLAIKAAELGDLDPVKDTASLYKYYMDDLYNEGIRRPIQYPMAEGTAAFDRLAIDGAVNGLGIGTRRLSGTLRYMQSGNVQRYAVFLFAGVAVLAFVITRL